MLKYTGHSTYCNKRPIQVERQLNKMKNGRSCGPDGIPTEALKQLGDWGVRQLTKIFNAIMQSGKMPDEWRESIITPIYKDKGDHMNCCNYRGIKLLSHTMKLWERIIDQRLVPARYVRQSQLCPQLDVSDKNDKKTQDMSDRARYVRQKL